MIRAWARFLLVTVLALRFASQASAQVPVEGASAEAWFVRVDRTEAEQPHWITPLATVTPRLEEEYRFDFFHEEMAGGARTYSYGGGKGLELIPVRRVEIILGVPAYLAHTPTSGENGWGDTNFLVKYRLFASNEKARDGILTLFLGASAPTATRGNGAGHWLYTPALAAGKGWRDFDVQSTFGVTLPGGAIGRLGTPLAWNTAFQYRVLQRLWPELEVNSTFWPNGARHGKNQVVVTPGLLVGRLHLARRAGLTFGAGVQIATTRFHLYNHNVVLTARIPF